MGALVPLIEQLREVHEKVGEMDRQIHAWHLLRFSRKGKSAPTRWAAELMSRKPYTVVAVALANKMARIVWALMTSGDRFRTPAAV